MVNINRAAKQFLSTALFSKQKHCFSESNNTLQQEAEVFLYITNFYCLYTCKYDFLAVLVAETEQYSKCLAYLKKQRENK